MSEKEETLKLIQTAIRHIQGLVKLRPELERKRDSLLAQMNTERNRGETDQSD